MVTGTHILINAGAGRALTDLPAFKTFILEAIAAFDLEQVGNVFHAFEGGGFTCVLCLTESHLALHTWPEHNFYTCDLYLCDYSRNNRQTAIDLCDKIKIYFGSYNVKEQIVSR